MTTMGEYRRRWLKSECQQQAYDQFNLMATLQNIIIAINENDNELLQGQLATFNKDVDESGLTSDQAAYLREQVAFAIANNEPVESALPEPGEAIVEPYNSIDYIRSAISNLKDMLITNVVVCQCGEQYTVKR